MGRHKISTKILGVAVGIAVSTLLVSGLVGFSMTRDAVETQAFEKLTAVREMKAQQIEDYFGFIRRQILTLSEDRMVIDAMREFRAAFDSFEEEFGSFYKPTSLLKRLVESGQLGAKSGRGFYVWENFNPVGVNPDVARYRIG